MGNNQDGPPGRALPSDNCTILPSVPQGHRLPPIIDHQVARQDLAPLPPQRDAEPHHLHRYDLQCPRGIHQQVLLQKIMGNKFWNKSLSNCVFFLRVC